MDCVSVYIPVKDILFFLYLNQTVQLNKNQDIFLAHLFQHINQKIHNSLMKQQKL